MSGTVNNVFEFFWEFKNFWKISKKATFFKIEKIQSVIKRFVDWNWTFYEITSEIVETQKINSKIKLRKLSKNQTPEPQLWILESQKLSWD